MIKVIFVLVILYVIFSVLNSKEKFTQKMDNKDKQYLEDIIKHHENTINIAELRMVNTDNPDMKYMMRKLIWNLDMEINQIKVALNLLFDVNLMDVVSVKDEAEIQRNWSNYIKNLENNYKNEPIIYSYCQKYKNNQRLKLETSNKDNAKFIDELVEHLKIGVELSKNIISKSLNDYVIDRANKLIYSHNKNIFLLTNMKNNKFKNKIIM
jgi:uncharacterized protein (DUF305 family)